MAVSYPVTDETRAYMCLAYVIRSLDHDYAVHMVMEAKRYGATDQQIADAWKTRAAISAPIQTIDRRIA